MLSQIVPIYTTPSLTVRLQNRRQDNIDLQEKLIVDNLQILLNKIESRLTDMDNDCKETIEIDFFGLNIYIDIATKGWDYRSIELLAVDIMNDDCDALNTAAQILFNSISELTNRLNAEMDSLYND